MTREAVKNDVPEEWRQRMKAGMCPVCGKLGTDFEPRMKVFCSHACRDEFAKSYTWWSDLRNKIFERDKETCQICRQSRETLQADYEKKRIGYIKAWAAIHKDQMEAQRSDRLLSLSRNFEREYKDIMNDDGTGNFSIMHHLIDDKKMADAIGKRPWSFELEADHKVPIALGGEMWDESNLQTVCKDCHAKKTIEDMKKINSRGGVR